MKNQIPDQWTPLHATPEREIYALTCCPLGYSSLYFVVKFNLPGTDNFVVVVAQRFEGCWGASPTCGAEGLFRSITERFGQHLAQFEWYFDTGSLDEVVMSKHRHRADWKFCGEKAFETRFGMHLPQLNTIPGVLSAEAAYTAAWNTPR